MGNAFQSGLSKYALMSYTIRQHRLHQDDLAGLTPIEVQDGSYIGEGLTNGTYYFVLVAESDYVDSEMSNVLTLEVAIPGPDVHAYR